MVAHQFDDAAQQRDAVSLGMWLFLLNEVMFFGGLFTVYVVYRVLFPEAFVHASHHLDVRLGAINTVVLIESSLTMALAVHAAELGRRRSLVYALVGTMLLGSTFLVIKSYEYWHKFQDGLVPGPLFTYAGPQAKQVELFLSIYFTMTGLHALHMVIGIGIIACLLRGALTCRCAPAYQHPTQSGWLYWHFVDVVWIFLFPLLYLIGRH